MQPNYLRKKNLLQTLSQKICMGNFICKIYESGCQSYREYMQASIFFTHIRTDAVGKTNVYLPARS